MIIWITTISLIILGLYLMYDSINIVANNTSKVKVPLIIPTNNVEVRLQRLFHNELTAGAMAMVLGLVILEISFINLLPKLLIAVSLYVLIDVLGYLRTERAS